MTVHHSENTHAAGPLAGTLVVDLSQALAGPHATMIMGDLGARVIKVESPGKGDDTRGWGPPFVGPAEDPQSTYFLAANRNKESIQLNLKDGDDMAVLKDLLGRADVLVENYRPGVLDRLGLSSAVLEAINPALVVLSISGFGHDGPEGARAGYDQIAQGEAGLMSVTGPDADHPTRVGVPIGDILAGLNGAIGVLAALQARQRTGRGTVVRTSLLASVVGAHAFQGTKWTVAKQRAVPTGNHHPQIAPYGAFSCADGYLQIAVGSESQWQVFAPLVGIAPGEDRFATNASRMENHAALLAVIEGSLCSAPRSVWLERFAEDGVPAGSIRSIDEVYQWDQTRSQGLIVSVEHPTLGVIELPGPSLRMEDFAGTDVARRSHGAPPLLDADGARIRAWLRTEVSVDA